MGNTWVCNSFVYTAHGTREVYSWVIAGIAIGAFQLVHRCSLPCVIQRVIDLS